MSALPEHSLPLRAPQPARRTAPAPRLRLVRAPVHTRTRVPFVMLCMSILAVALLGSLLLNTTMARDAYAAHDLQIELSQLAQSAQEHAARLDTEASPAQLAKSAGALGMVPAPEVAFLRLKDGKVLGNPTRATVPPSAKTDG